MKKYKLINIKTNEEHLCDKVTIDGFDYYVSKEKSLSNDGDWYLGHPNYDTLFKWEMKGMHEGKQVWINKVIACNNPNIDVPKVVDEIEELALKTTLHPKVLFDELKKCSQNDALLIDEFGDYNIIRYRETTGFILGYNKSQETHPFSEEDMIEFAEFVAKYTDKNKNHKGEVLHAKSKYDGAERTTDLLQLWKEQQPITLYYES